MSTKGMCKMAYGSYAMVRPDNLLVESGTNGSAPDAHCDKPPDFAVRNKASEIRDAML
jgi:hypothetical protein